ncbi:MAG: hypothetical protein IT270_14305 [Saprospiraceae bacterium]|nr:hypothetical protein [Saprospiraceae bacterium]
MIIIIVDLLGFSHTPPHPCSFGKRELNIALNALGSRYLLGLDSNKININTLEIEGFEYSDFKNESWQVGSKTVQSVEYHRNIPWVKFSSRKPIEGTDLTINFSTLEGGRRSQGTISFVCENDSLFFKDIQYLTSIE